MGIENPNWWLCWECLAEFTEQDKDDADGVCGCGGELVEIGPDGFEVTR